MKAVYATGTNYDDPLSVLEVGTMPEPETKPFWSTIRVNSASVNHHDVWSLQGVGLSDEQTPMILGTDAAGVLEEDIPVRKGLKAGSEVVLYTFVGTDGAGVMPGERRSILSERYAGTMAEYTQVPSANVFAKPANLNLDEAAALGTSWLTAYSLLFASANVKPGDTVLIQGAGGGVSTAAIQLAHAAGLEVFVTSRSETSVRECCSSVPMRLLKRVRDCHARWMPSLNPSARPHGVIPSNPYVREELSPFAARLLATSRVQSLRESSSRIFECRAIPWAPVRISHVC